VIRKFSKPLCVAYKKRVDKVANNQSTNQPINQSTNQPINQSTNQPINQSTNQPGMPRQPD
jgi:PT repeat